MALKIGDKVKTVNLASDPDFDKVRDKIGEVVEIIKDKIWPIRVKFPGICISESAVDDQWLFYEKELICE